MARPLRIEYPNAVYHVTSRGNEKKAIYRLDEDRNRFLDILATVNERFNWLCHAYCLMGNHYHLIIETPDGNLVRGMRQLNGVYTQAYNRAHRRTGHLFQGRYKAIVIQKDSHLLEACRYVVLNPVRAGMVADPRGWQWSSYRATAGYGKPDACLTTGWVLSQFDSQKERAIREYRVFVKSGMNKNAIWAGVRSQIFLGEDRFVEGLIGYAQGFKDIQEIPKSQRILDRPGLDRIFQKKSARKMRNKAIRTAVVQYGYTQKEVADYLEMHYSTISRLINEYEKYQD